MDQGVLIHMKPLPIHTYHCHLGICMDQLRIPTLLLSDLQEPVMTYQIYGMEVLILFLKLPTRVEIKL